MSEPIYQQVILKDPLSEETRKERRNLLAVSALGIVMVKSGLIPSKISALGIEFSQADQNVLLYALAIITIYFLLAFIFYALSDFMNYRIATYVSGVKYQINKIEQLDKVIASYKDQTKKLQESSSEYKKVGGGLKEVNVGLKEVNKDMGVHIQELKKAIENKTSGKDDNSEVSIRGPEFKARGDELFARNDELKVKGEVLDAQSKEIKIQGMEIDARNQDIVNNELLVNRAKVVAVLRIMFDCIVPLGVGAYAVVVLFGRY